MKKQNPTSQRKKEHIELCLTDSVAFKEKTNGFDKYDFIHYAPTEVEIEKINLKEKFFGKEVNYPFMISCMTGGTSEAENINAKLAIAASELNIPIGVGSQRQALENSDHLSSYKIIRKNAANVPVLGNLGAAQIVQLKSSDKIKYLIEIIEADSFVIHINPLQELIQKNGEPNFHGLLNSIEKICNEISVPIIAKEVGAGISKQAAKDLLDAGVKGIDVAGAGGTSWSAVEILRNKEYKDDYFWEWGIPTSYCIKEIKKLKKKNDFLLIASGGINNGVDLAKSFALGADFSASARIILQELEKNKIEGVKNLIIDWFETLKRIMFLTGKQNLSDFKNSKLIIREEFY